MTTRETIESYFTALVDGNRWEDLLAEGMVFTSHTAPARQVTGRDAYIQANRGFYGMIDEMQVRQLIIDGNTACALTHYRLRPPAGDPFTSDVAEVFTVDGDHIDTFAIYFDTAPYPT